MMPINRKVKKSNWFQVQNFNSSISSIFGNIRSYKNIAYRSNIKKSQKLDNFFTIKHEQLFKHYISDSTLLFENEKKSLSSWEFRKDYMALFSAH